MSLCEKIISGFLVLALILFAAGALSIYELTKFGYSYLAEIIIGTVNHRLVNK
jgi:hypothetical protein